MSDQEPVVPPPPPPPPPPTYGQPSYGGPAQAPYGTPGPAPYGYPPQHQPAYGYPYGYPPPDNSKKILAGIMGILFGSLGVHKFILGYTTEGLVMLLVTVLTCGIGGIVMSVIGI